MSPDSKPVRSPALGIATIIVPLLPVLYVLSIGPVQWLAYRGYLNHDAARFAEWFYSPLGYAAMVDAIGHAFIWYLSFWR